MGEIKPTETGNLQFGRGYQSTLTAHFVFRRYQKPNASKIQKRKRMLSALSGCANQKLLNENLMVEY